MDSSPRDFAENLLPDHFLRDIFEVMLIAWESVVVPDWNTNEPRITALWNIQCREVNKMFAEFGPIFDFFHEAQENDPETGKQLCRKDIEVRLYVGRGFTHIKYGSTARNAPYLIVESKKLSNNSDITEYLGSKGMGRFTECRYESDKAFSAMAGYIQPEQDEAIKQALVKCLNESQTVRQIGKFQLWSILPQYPGHGKTRHKIGDDEMDIFHLMLPTTVQTQESRNFERMAEETKKQAGKKKRLPKNKRNDGE